MSDTPRYTGIDGLAGSLLPKHDPAKDRADGSLHVFPALSPTEGSAIEAGHIVELVSTPDGHMRVRRASNISKSFGKLGVVAGVMVDGWGEYMVTVGFEGTMISISYKLDVSYPASAGDTMYLSGAPGMMSNAPPTRSGRTVRDVGVLLRVGVGSADFLFHPSQEPTIELV